MKNFIISLLIFLLWAFLGMWWYYSCPICETSHNKNYQQVDVTKEKENSSEIDNTVTAIPTEKVSNSFFNIIDEMETLFLLLMSN